MENNLILRADFSCLESKGEVIVLYLFSSDYSTEYEMETSF